MCVYKRFFQHDIAILIHGRGSSLVRLQSRLNKRVGRKVVKNVTCPLWWRELTFARMCHNSLEEISLLLNVDSATSLIR